MNAEGRTLCHKWVLLQYLYNLHEVADKNNDGQFADFVEVMLEEQVIHSSGSGNLMADHCVVQHCMV